MRHRARSLHVLALAPVAAILAAALGPSTHAGASDPPPAPVVVAIDPGHGGLPDPHHPTQPFDPGAIGPNGLQEKDVTLDTAERVAALLRQDLVDVVLTRRSDAYVSIAQREQTSIDHHASLFVSIHVNSFTGPGTGGSLVLYPNAMSEPFAQTLSDSLGTALAADAVADDGITLRDNWWIHNPVPTATVEMAFISNPREAALMATGSFRQEVAASIRGGIEAYDPTIVARRGAILAWRQAHRGAPSAAGSAPAGAQVPAQPASPLGAVLTWLVAIAVVAALLRWREPVARVLVALIALAGRAVSGVMRLRRAAVRRRRRRLRARDSRQPDHTWEAASSVLDDLPL